MIFYGKDLVNIIAVDPPTGNVTIQHPYNGPVRCVPMLALRASGGDRELRHAIKACERKERGEQ